MSNASDTKPFDPIFIVGAPRSGTTLLRAILSRHPRIGISDETYFFYSVYRRRQTFGDLRDEANRHALIESYMATERMRQLRIDLSGLKARLMAEGTSYPAFFATMLQFYAEVHGKMRPGEKTPHHANYVNTLLDWYPNGKVIHLVRDPRDVCASLRNMPWGRKAAITNARLWVELTTAAERGSGNRRFHRVRYEDLVAHPERMVRELCQFVEEKYDPAMLGNASVPTADDPCHQRSHRSPNKERLGVWRRQLSRDEVSLIEGVAGPLMISMGYRRNGTPASAALRLTGSLDSVAEELREKITRAPRLWYSWVQPRNLAGLEKWTDR